MHWLVRHPGFCDISAVLTLILTHEQSLEWEFDNVRNAESKLGFLGPPRIDFESNLVKFVKNIR